MSNYKQKIYNFRKSSSSVSLGTRLRRKLKYLDYTQENKSGDKAEYYRLLLYSIGIHREDILADDEYTERAYQKNKNLPIGDDLVNIISSSIGQDSHADCDDQWLMMIKSYEEASDEDNEMGQVDGMLDGDTWLDHLSEIPRNVQEIKTFSGEECLDVALDKKIVDGSTTVDASDEVGFLDHDYILELFKPTCSEVIRNNDEIHIVLDVVDSNVENEDDYLDLSKDVSSKFIPQQECKVCDLCNIQYTIGGKLQYNSLTSSEVQEGYKHILELVDDSVKSLIFKIFKLSNILSPHLCFEVDNFIIDYETICDFFNKRIRWFKNRKEVFFLGATLPLKYYDAGIVYDEVIEYSGVVYPTFSFSDGTTFAYDAGDIYLVPFYSSNYVYYVDQLWCKDPVKNKKNISCDKLLSHKGFYYLADSSVKYILQASSPVMVVFHGSKLSHNKLMNIVYCCCDFNKGQFDLDYFYVCLGRYNRINYECIRVLLNYCGIFYFNGEYVFFDYVHLFYSCALIRSSYSECDCFIKYIREPINMLKPFDRDK